MEISSNISESFVILPLGSTKTLATPNPSQNEQLHSVSAYPEGPHGMLAWESAGSRVTATMLLVMLP